MFGLIFNFNFRRNRLTTNQIQDCIGKFLGKKVADENKVRELKEEIDNEKSQKELLSEHVKTQAEHLKRRDESLADLKTLGDGRKQELGKSRCSIVCTHSMEYVYNYRLQT